MLVRLFRLPIRLLQYGYLSSLLFTYLIWLRTRPERRCGLSPSRFAHDLRLLGLCLAALPVPPLQRPSLTDSLNGHRICFPALEQGLELLPTRLRNLRHLESKGINSTITPDKAWQRNLPPVKHPLRWVDYLHMRPNSFQVTTITSFRAEYCGGYTLRGVREIYLIRAVVALP